MNTIVNFEIAKLLKEKRFDQKSTDNGYNLNGENSFDYTIDRINGVGIAAPTIADVVMWLYKEQDIWITVERHDPKALFNYVIIYQDEVAIKESRGKGYKSPTEAYEAAIEYCLNNLI